MATITLKKYTGNTEYTLRMGDGGSFVDYIVRADSLDAAKAIALAERSEGDEVVIYEGERNVAKISAGEEA